MKSYLHWFSRLQYKNVRALGVVSTPYQEYGCVKGNVEVYVV
jgi:hypothetical protein